MISKVYNALMRRTGLQFVKSHAKTQKKVKNGEKIKVVFYCQLPHIWGCMESVYEAATKDANIDAYILAIPNNWDKEVKDTDALEFCKENNYNVISAYDKATDTFFDLEDFQPDYVFFPRPYDYYLPEQYRSYNVVKYASTCYICYSYIAEGGYIIDTCFDTRFTSHCYFIFADNDSTEGYCKANHALACKLGTQKIVKTPFPRFDLMNKWKGCEPEHWKLKKEEVKKRIIWTPRWATEEELGGTNFFTYKDFFFDFAKKHPECDFLFRPHPLAFENFIKTGLMSEEEVREFKETCKKGTNIQLDERKEFLDSFASADILVSDLSGVIEDFLVTGNPLVFCSYETEFNEANEKLVEGFYMPHNAEELEEILETLIRGEDSRKDRRQQLVKEILGENDGKNGERIIDFIRKDAGIK